MKNLGVADRVIRVVLGLVILAAALYTGPLETGWQHWITIAIGLVLIVSAVLAVCPAYALIGVRTCRTR